VSLGAAEPDAAEYDDGCCWLRTDSACKQCRSRPHGTFHPSFRSAGVIKTVWQGKSMRLGLLLGDLSRVPCVCAMSRLCRPCGPEGCCTASVLLVPVHNMGTMTGRVKTREHNLVQASCKRSGQPSCRCTTWAKEATGHTCPWQAGLQDECRCASTGGAKITAATRAKHTPFSFAPL